MKKINQILKPGTLKQGKIKNYKTTFLVIAAALLSLGTIAQEKLPGDAPTVQSDNSDITRTKKPAKKSTEPKPYKEVIISKAISANDFFTVDLNKLIIIKSGSLSQNGNPQ